LALHKQVAKVRIQGFQELMRRLDELCYSSDLSETMAKSGVAFSEMLIGHGVGPYHPIVHALNNVAMKMYDTIPLLEKFDEIASNEQDWTLPELTEIEYLPLPNMKANFERPTRRNPEKLKKHSQLVLAAIHMLKEQPHGFILK